jgi:hypothetical protein
MTDPAWLVIGDVKPGTDPDLEHFSLGQRNDLRALLHGWILTTHEVHDPGQQEFVVETHHQGQTGL